MSDLERRLRKWAERWPSEVNTANLVIEAANRIAKLETDLHNAIGGWSLDRNAIPFYEQRIAELGAMIRELCDDHGLIEPDYELPDRAMALLGATSKKDLHS